MFETKRPSVEARVPCKVHGESVGEKHPLYGAPEPTVPWTGAVRCMFCYRVYLCADGGESRVYPDAPSDGSCQCGSMLFPTGPIVDVEHVTFTAEPKCGECAKVLVQQQIPRPKTEAASP